MIVTALLPVRCPHCHGAVAVSADLFGQPAACPLCGEGFLSPEAPPSTPVDVIAPAVAASAPLAGPSPAPPAMSAGPTTPFVAQPAATSITTVPHAAPIGAAAPPPAGDPDRGPRRSRRISKRLRLTVMVVGALMILIVVAILASRKSKTRR